MDRVSQGQPKNLSLEREAGRLRISYFRSDGKQVVETWRPRPGEFDWPVDAGAGSDR